VQDSLISLSKDIMISKSARRWQACLFYGNRSSSMWFDDYQENHTFNQGVTGSRPVRPTKANKPTLLRYFEKNQGVKTLGQPTPWFYRFYRQISTMWQNAILSHSSAVEEYYSFSACDNMDICSKGWQYKPLCSERAVLRLRRLIGKSKGSDKSFN